MPISKRSKPVSFEKAKKKTRTEKAEYIDNVRNCFDTYASLVVLRYSGMRGCIFKDIRIAFRDSRFFLGKNSLMQIALGRTPEDESRPNLRLISNILHGSVCLLFSNRNMAEISSYFSNYHVPDFSSPGSLANRTCLLVNEIDNENDEVEYIRFNDFPMLGNCAPKNSPYLSNLMPGAVFEVENEKVMFRNPPYEISKRGEPISVQQSRIMRFLDLKFSEFIIYPIATYDIASSDLNLIDHDNLPAHDDDDDVGQNDDDAKPMMVDEDEEEDTKKSKSKKKKQNKKKVTAKASKLRK